MDDPSLPPAVPAEPAPPPPPPPLGVQRAVVPLLSLVAAGLVIAGLYFGSDILVPFALAVLLAFLLDPLVTRLRRWHWPRALAVAVVMLCTVAVLGATSLFVGAQLVQLGRDLPTYQTTIQHKLRGLREAVTGRGMADASRMIGVVENELEAARKTLDQATPRGRQAPMRVQVEPTPPSPVRTIGTLVGPMLQPLATSAVVLMFVIFLLLGRNDLRDRVLRLAGGELHRMTDALNEAAERVSRYLAMQLMINLAYGVPMAFGLWLIGVPGALLWGLLAAVLRFVPYIGLMIASVFPLALAFAVDPGWSMFLLTAALILTLEGIVNYLAEPWLYGSSTGLAPIAVLVAAAFWTMLWGPIGLLLAMPLTVCLVALGRHLPQLRVLEILLGRAPAFDAPTRLYQRLLAGDTDETREFSERQLRSGLTLPRFADEVVLPALQRAELDWPRLPPEHRQRIVDGTQQLLRELVGPWPPALEQLLQRLVAGEASQPAAPDKETAGTAEAVPAAIVISA